MIANLTRFALICLVALPLWVLLRRPWKRRLPREIALSLFAAYLTALLVMALDGAWRSPAAMLQSALARIRSLDNINLVPFAVIREQLATFHQDSSRMLLLGNTLLFAPYGFFLPLLWRRFRSSLRIAGMCLLLTCSIEFIQLFIERMVDVDDLLLNFAGSMTGTGLWWICHRLIPAAEVLSE